MNSAFLRGLEEELDQIVPYSRQNPARWSEEWTDPTWRALWLNDLSDDELDNMSPMQKGNVLPAYLWDCGHETYGTDAVMFSIAHEVLSNARIPVERLQKHQLIALGKSISDWSLKS